MNSNYYKQILNNAYRDKELTPEDFNDTLTHFAKLYANETNR